MNLPSNWKSGTLGDAISSVRGGFSVKCENREAAENELAVLKTGSVLNGNFDVTQNKFVPPMEHASLRTPVSANTIILCRKNSEETIGVSAFVQHDFPNVFLSDLLWELRPAENVSKRWLLSVLQSGRTRALIRMQSTGTQSTMKNISKDRLLAIPIGIPTLSEQIKIAEILRTWDEAIEKTDELIAYLEKQAAGLRLCIFEGEYASDNRLIRAREVFETVSEKGRPDLSLLAVMQDIGIVRRDDLDRRVVMPEGETSNYKVVLPGDFVISLRSFEGGLEYSGICGLVSPAYTVLRPALKIDSDYYRHFFKSRSFIGRLDKLIFGIRDGKQIAFRDFGDMRIPNPLLADQQQYSRALNDATELVATANKKKIALESQKRGLMQKLLTGEWRVNTEEFVPQESGVTHA